MMSRKLLLDISLYGDFDSIDVSNINVLVTKNKMVSVIINYKVR